MTTSYQLSDAQPVPKLWKNSTPLSFIAENDIIHHAVSLCSFEVSCSGYLYPNLLPIPSLLAEGQSGKTEKVLTLRKNHSATAKMLLSCQHCFGHKSQTRHCAGCSEENNPNQFHYSLPYEVMLLLF